MGAAALPFLSLLALLFGLSSVPAQDLRERDALCNTDRCFVVYFQRKTFLDSWRACKEKGGNLVTIKRQEEADNIATLFSSVDLRYSRTKVRVWIGLQRQPRQCTSRPLRGFSWTTGDQDTEYTNWQREDSPGLCSAPRCVVMSYSTAAHEQADNFKWLDGSCTVPVDGYLCHYGYEGMCPALWSEGGGNTLYTTPFNLLTTLLTHVPFGSVASVPCPTKDEQSVLCMLKEDGSVGWSRNPPLCSDPPVTQNWCDQGNGGCEHFCRLAGAHVYCECAPGFQLGEDGLSCRQADVCQAAPCEFECMPLLDGYRCACPEGYMLAPDERGCLDVDECLQSPCEHLCVNAPGTFECRCLKGYHPDETGGCEDVDECMNDPCEHACENTPGSHICHCHLGFSPLPEDLSRCQDTDECQIVGTCEQMCVNYEGGFECYCEVGYELMSDHYSCQKIGGDGQSPVTPPFLWATPPVWDPEDPLYNWNQEQIHTDWPPEAAHSLDWLTDPPRVLGSDVIWVTSAPQEELPFDSALDIPTEGPKEEEEEDMDRGGGEYVLEWSDRPQVEDDPTTISTPPPPPTTSPSPTPDWYEDEEVVDSALDSPTEETEEDVDREGAGHASETDPTTISTPPPPTISPSPTPDWYEDEEEETTMLSSILPTSTISEGAWNFWERVITVSQKQAVDPVTNPEITSPEIPTDPSYYNEEEEDQYTLMENSQFPQEDVEEKATEENVNSQVLTVPTQLPPEDLDDIVDSVQDDRVQKQGNTWLLVGLLVPICIFIVVMVALGIIYCTRCAVQLRNKNATDCYHWISGAHNKQGAPNPPAGVKTHV
ncbi:hypothetical protein LDENG_00141230 [Lucifuga dentata]|nr:hypothetical protein LDENG_00141230 [Lucifuga dentata]